jgi:hypothetical protein
MTNAADEFSIAFYHFAAQRFTFLQYQRQSVAQVETAHTTRHYPLPWLRLDALRFSCKIIVLFVTRLFI